MTNSQASKSLNNFFFIQITKNYMYIEGLYTWLPSKRSTDQIYRVILLYTCYFIKSQPKALPLLVKLKSITNMKIFYPLLQLSSPTPGTVKQAVLHNTGTKACISKSKWFQKIQVNGTKNISYPLLHNAP